MTSLQSLGQSPSRRFTQSSQSSCEGNIALGEALGSKGCGRALEHESSALHEQVAGCSGLVEFATAAAARHQVMPVVMNEMPHRGVAPNQVIQAAPSNKKKDFVEEC